KFFQFVALLRVNFQVIAGVFAMLFLVSLWGEFAGAAKLLTLHETALENVIDNGCANGANEKNYECPKPRRTPKNGHSFPAIDRVAEPLICLFVGACLVG